MQIHILTYRDIKKSNCKSLRYIQWALPNRKQNNNKSLRYRYMYTCFWWVLFPTTWTNTNNHFHSKNKYVKCFWWVLFLPTPSLHQNNKEQIITITNFILKKKKWTNKEIHWDKGWEPEGTTVRWSPYVWFIKLHHLNT